MRALIMAACCLVLLVSAARPASAQLITGAEGFTLRMGAPFATLGQAQLSWDAAGPSTAGYAILRYSDQVPQGELLSFPFWGNATALPADFVTLSDYTPLVPGLTCYVLVPMDANALPLGHSDVLCKMNGFQTGSFPALFGVTLGQTSTATVSWSYVQGITGMVVVSSSGEVVSAAHPVQALTLPIATGTCYRGYALAGEAVVGATDVVCAVPGQFAAPGTALDVAKIASGVTTVPR